MKSLTILAAGALALSALLPAPVLAQFKESATVDESTGVLSEVMSIPAKAIPESLLADAQGLAIVPNVVKGGLGIGVRFGRGVLLVRDESGKWSAPVLVSLTGGSFGWQIGIQSTDVVLIFKTRKSVQTLLAGKLTLGADAAVAAGPIGRQAAAAAEVTQQSAVLSYSRSRGLFIGLALDGTVINIDEKANAAYYGNNGQISATPTPPQSGTLPQSATRLLEYVQKYTSVTPPAPPPLSGQ